MKPEPNLAPANIDDLNVFSNPFDVRHDLHAFIEYVREREVKRSHRGNELSSADIKRLAKLMSHSSVIEFIESYGFSNWINYVDELVLLLKFVKYDTEGRYAGYTSSEPSFPDNYIEFDANKYKEFIDLPLIEQERKLLDILVNNYIDGNNEFYVTGVLGNLSGFSTRGSATGIMPGLDFAKPRRFLIEILHSCKAGVWYTTSSMIQYLKKHHPFFLIPRSQSMNINMMQRMVDMAISMRKRRSGVMGQKSRSVMWMHLSGWKVALWNDFLKDCPLI
jgi:hypothetical protein